jgi:hypothetical protein
MLVRISLIISLICLGFSIWFSHDENKGVQGRKNKVEEDRKAAETARDKSTEARKKKDGERDAEFTVLHSTSNEWYGVRVDITNKVNQIAAMQKTIDKYGLQQKNYEDDSERIKEGNRGWFDLNTTARKVKQERTRLPKAEVELATTKTELDVIGRDNMRLKNTMIKLRPAGPQALPEGLSGKVVAFDPKFQYVVLNVGGNHGVLMDGRLLIKRDNEILGQARVTRVEDEYSVANIIQEFKEGEVSEGDWVVYQGTMKQ